ncbi:uncharacterized protein LOC128091961 isoform X5 [Tympanuchus pallidicinctus]|uniref:uncharacterized protein LOC128091961 isoform X5 n=1 Tax=Tympanuchus pallidicinctus TaxID=109042 RepID=UPI002286E26A|nr:uncharacterized protein LOC128091961 isoform X5 [Tympanuchus pallidicinctus]
MPTCATCCRNCLGRGLDSMSSAAPFQPLQFCDAVISGVARLGSAPLGRGMAPPAGDVSRELQESIRRALGRPRIHLLLRARLETKPRRLEERILALTAWRLHLFGPTTPAKQGFHSAEPFPTCLHKDCHEKLHVDLHAHLCAHVHKGCCLLPGRRFPERAGDSLHQCHQPHPVPPSTPSS